MQETYELGHLNDEWADKFQLHSFLHNQYSELSKGGLDDLREQVGLIAEQNDLLRSIRERLNVKQEQSFIQDCSPEVDNSLDKSFQFFKESSTLISSRSQLFESRVRLRTDVSFNESSHRRRRSTNLTGSPLERAINEIDQQCSRQTYEFVCRVLNGEQDRVSKMKALENGLTKCETELAILQQRYEQQTKQRACLQKRLQAAEAEASHKSKQWSQREIQLTRMQTAQVLKERILAQQEKKLATKLQQIRSKESKLVEERKDIDKIWEDVLLRVEADCVPSESFKTRVYARCKQSLVCQRKLLSEEQEAFDKEHECLNRILSQLKERRVI